MADDEDVLDLQLQEAKFKLRSPDGSVGVYTLRELDGVGRDLSINRIAKMGTVQSDGTIVGVNVAGIKAAELASCLFGPDGKRVPAEVIDAWPSRVIDKLNAKLADLSALTKRGEDAAKNVSSGARSAEPGSASPAS